MPWLPKVREGIRRNAPVAAALLPWVGGVLMLVAAAFAVRDWSLVRTQVRVEATVTENASVFGAGGVLYYPRLRFRTAGGDLVQVLGQPGTPEIEFPAAAVLPVIYPVGHPERAVIGTAWRVYPTAIVLGVLGVVVFDVGLLLRLLVRKKFREGAIAVLRVALNRPRG